MLGDMISEIKNAILSNSFFSFCHKDSSKKRK